MIVYLVTADHAYTLNRYLQEWAPSLSDQIQAIFYEERPWDWLSLEATYIFSDLERLNPSEMLKATAYADHLISLGYRILNHPHQVPTRLALQKLLHEAGINPFRMFPIKNHPELKFPVFLRLANSHQGSIGDLIYSKSELEQRLVMLGKNISEAEDLVVVEYCDVSSSNGRYMKYSVMRVEDVFVPRHAMTSAEWMIKVPDIVDAEAIRLETEFLLEYPQREAILSIFSLAKIDFGRIDFGIQNGQIRVWEINTNPIFMPQKKNVDSAREKMVNKTNQWLLQALLAINSVATDETAWKKISNRHIRARKWWWWQRKLFLRKRA